MDAGKHHLMKDEVQTSVPTGPGSPAHTELDRDAACQELGPSVPSQLHLT